MAIAASLILLFVAASLLWLNLDGKSGTVAQETATGIIFRLPVLDRGADGMGYAGAEVAPDSVVVQVIAEGAYSNHYRFADTLQLFSKGIAQRTDGWRLQYDSNSNTYTLTIDGKKYQLERGFNRINLLEAK